MIQLLVSLSPLPSLPPSLFFRSAGAHSICSLVPANLNRAPTRSFALFHLRTVFVPTCLHIGCFLSIFSSFSGHRSFLSTIVDPWFTPLSIQRRCFFRVRWSRWNIHDGSCDSKKGKFVGGSSEGCLSEDECREGAIVELSCIIANDNLIASRGFWELPVSQLRYYWLKSRESLEWYIIAFAKLILVIFSKQAIFCKLR